MPHTKTALVRKLLVRKKGCTRSEVLKATRWPAVSMQTMARSTGLHLLVIKKRQGQPAQYFGA